MKTSQSLLGQAIVPEPATNNDNVIRPLLDAVSPLSLQRHSAGQSGALLRFLDETGVVLSSVDATGAFTGAAASPAGAVILAPATAGRNTIQPTADVTSLLINRPAANTTAPIFRIVDLVSASEMFSISPPGSNLPVLIQNINPSDVGFTLLEASGQSVSTFFIGDSGFNPLFAVGPGAKIGFLGAAPVVRQTNGTAADLAAIADAHVKAFLTAVSNGLVNLGLFAAPA